MKIYIANPEIHDLKVATNILLSFYDIYIYLQFHLEN